MAGTLFIVATPIGNLRDISLRAIEVLKKVDVVVCEDTRVTGRLLSEYGIDKKMIVMNDFNEERQIKPIVTDLTDGKNVALVSDAGTPLVSDPGFKLVREAVSKGIKAESIPGASAAIAALCVSGFPTDKFMFVGYLSKKDGKRKAMLEDWKKIKDIVKTTFVIYESPFRVVKTLESMKEVFGDIDIVICRELTKLHEEVRREKVSESLDHFYQSSPKGEFVIMI